LLRSLRALDLKSSGSMTRRLLVNTPNLLATHKKQKRRLVFETKSRKRSWGMNYIGSVTPETHLKGDVFDLYEKAIQASTGGRNCRF